MTRVEGSLKALFGRIEEEIVVKASKNHVIKSEKEKLGEFKSRRKLSRKLPHTIKEQQENGSLERVSEVIIIKLKTILSLPLDGLLPLLHQRPNHAEW